MDWVFWVFLPPHLKDLLCIYVLPFRQPADRTILNPPKSRNVCSPCFTFSLPASPRCGAPLAPHTETLSETFFETFFEASSKALSEALPKRYVNESKDGHLPSEHCKKGCWHNPKIKAQCFNLKLYPGRSNLHLGHRFNSLFFCLVGSFCCCEFCLVVDFC